MSPSDHEKQLTSIIENRCKDIGFKRKGAGRLYRNTGNCNEYITFSFTRDRGFPGNLYSMTCTLSFDYTEIHKLACHFLDKEYRRGYPLAAVPFYTLLPEYPPVWRKYCSEDKMEDYAVLLYNDLEKYAVPFFERYDSEEKLEIFFEKYPRRSELNFDIDTVNCFLAAALCKNEKYDKLERLLNEPDKYSDEQKERIRLYIKKEKSLP